MPDKFNREKPENFHKNLHLRAKFRVRFTKKKLGLRILVGMCAMCGENFAEG